MEIIQKTRNGKIIATNKQLEMFGIPDRFRKRTEVVVFGEPIDVSERGVKELVYIIGDIEDDEIKYYIPTEWVLITET